MIKITHVETFGFEGAIRGMRNPYMSHDKSDSRWVADCSCICPFFSNAECDSTLVDRNSLCPTKYYCIGKADMTLAKKLIKAGPEHRKFLRMIHVQADVTAPRYWWQEASCYKWLSMNSSSTMHLITKRELTIDDFSLDEMGPATEIFVFSSLIEQINSLIKYCKKAKDENLPEAEDWFLKTIKQLLPESYNQLRTIDTNYECLMSIYHQRKNHRLTEWREFCEWLKTLPYMADFLEVGNGD